MSSPVYLTVEVEMTETATTNEVKSATVGLPGPWQVIALYVVDNDGIAADAANVTDLSFEDGSGNEIGSWNTTTGQDGALTAKTPASVTLAGTPTQRLFDQGDSIVFKKTDAGTGQATTAVMTVVLEQKR